MLVAETIGRIRREHFQKGKSIKEIARDRKISRNTVRKVLRSGETSFSYECEVQPRPKLGAWKAEIDRVLAANATKHAHERLTLIRAFEELRALGCREVVLGIVIEDRNAALQCHDEPAVDFCFRAH
jgi:AraC-like DNA-binding protein